MDQVFSKLNIVAFIIRDKSFDQNCFSSKVVHLRYFTYCVFFVIHFFTFLWYFLKSEISILKWLRRVCPAANPQFRNIAYECLLSEEIYMRCQSAAVCRRCSQLKKKRIVNISCSHTGQRCTRLELYLSIYLKYLLIPSVNCGIMCYF